MPKTKYYNLMKKLLNWVVLPVLMLVMAIPMVSCDDDDDPQYPTVTVESLQGSWKRGVGDEEKSYIFYTVVNPEDKALMTGGRWVEVEQEGLVTIKELTFDGNNVTAKTSDNVLNVGDYAIKNGYVSMKVGDIDKAFKAQFRGMDRNNIGFSYECPGSIMQRVLAEDGVTQVTETVAVVKVKVTVHFDRVTK